MSDDRIEVLIMGVEVGTAEGWDSYGDDGVCFVDFKPNEKFKVLFEKEPDNFAFDMSNGNNSYWPKGEAQNGHGIDLDNKKLLQLLLENM